MSASKRRNINVTVNTNPATPFKPPFGSKTPIKLGAIAEDGRSI